MKTTSKTSKTNAPQSLIIAGLYFSQVFCAVISVIGTAMLYAHIFAVSVSLQTANLAQATVKEEYQLAYNDSIDQMNNILATFSLKFAALSLLAAVAVWIMNRRAVGAKKRLIAAAAVTAACVIMTVFAQNIIQSFLSMTTV